MKSKQVIVVRRDINFGTKGKLAAQVAHASLGAILSSAYETKNENGSLSPSLTIPLDGPLSHWLTEKFTKIVLKCDSEEELLALAKQCEDEGIRHALIRDAGHTVFDEPTYTCLGIGPDADDRVNLITKHLKLM